MHVQICVKGLRRVEVWATFRIRKERGDSLRTHEEDCARKLTGCKEEEWDGTKQWSGKSTDKALECITRKCRTRGIAWHMAWQETIGNANCYAVFFIHNASY